MLKRYVDQALRERLEAAVAAGDLPEVVLRSRVTATTDPRHGDWSTNAALVGAKAADRPPRELAERIATLLEPLSFVERIEVAGPGFVNLFVVPEFEGQVFAERFEPWRQRGGPLEPESEQRSRIHLEAVSANPTGPLHIGHGRGAAVADSVARLLRRVGHEVLVEYYVNDAGRQMEVLGASLEARVAELLGLEADFPEDGYRGDYLRELAERFVAVHGEAFRAWTPDERRDRCRRYAEEQILAGIQADLEAFRVRIDRWQSERELYEQGRVEAALAELEAGGHVEEREGALWFRSDRFGDEKPRVLVRSDGQPTYFAADVAYHREKFARGFDRALDFWGADHHGYEPRVRAALRALGVDDARLEVHLIQFVSLVAGGEAVAMSTRAGTFETLAEIVASVGVDAARFFYLLRRPESHLEFDVELARKQANENPVYYVQYAHARVASLRRKATEAGLRAEGWGPGDLVDAEDRRLLREVLRYPGVVLEAAAERAPHQIVFYLQDLAATFHAYYNKRRILDASEPGVRAARLALADAVGWVLADALTLIGVSAPERM